MATTRLSWKHTKKTFFFRQYILRSTKPTLRTFTTSMSSPFLREEPHANGNDILRTLCKEDRLKEALHILYLRDWRGLWVDSDTYTSLLKGCINKRALGEGKLVHGHIIQTGFKSKTFLANTLVIMYTKSDCLVDARRVLNEMVKPNVVSWNLMIASHVRNGHGEEALRLFYHMKRMCIEPNQFTFVSVLPACANLLAPEYGEDVHEEIIRTGLESNVFLGSSLVHMYVKCGNLESARKVFDKMSERDVVSWNAMIAGYAQTGHVEEALKLLRKMPEKNVISWTAMIAGFAQKGQADEALKLFEQIPQPDVVSWTAMIAAYAKNGYIDQALKLFQKMPERDVASWNAMISGYGQNGHVDEAMELFQTMPTRNMVSWTSIITAYVHNGHVDDALKLFQKMPERDVASWNAMITGYAQNGRVEEALKLFHEMPEQNVVSWTAIISGHAQNGCFDKALNLFRQMQMKGVNPNSETFACILPVCANLAALEHGKEFHEDIIRRGYQSDVFVENALIDLYAKCGSIGYAFNVFEKMPRRNVVSWTTMIAGYAMHGYGKEALQLFEQMQHSGINPDHVTFVGVLSACCHAGLVDDGWKYFDCMNKYYHVTPLMEHYCCMVDLLGRAGRLDEVQDFINKMPIEPDATVWVSLLGACRVHTNVELGECVAEHLFELDPKNPAPYVLLSNIYAAAGRWDDIEKVRKMMKDRGVKRKPGCSWIEVNKEVYTFFIGDGSYLQTPDNLCKVGKVAPADNRGRI
eukprot:Gb_37632 [translate_table: standard]